MKKTLLITLDFWPNRGGVANYYYNLAKNFPQNKICVLTNTKESANFDFKVYNKRLLYDFFWLRWTKCIFETIKILKKEKVEIIWVGNILPLGIVAYIVKKIFKIPYFVSLHGFDILLAKRNLWKRKITKIILNNADFIAPNSNFTKSLLDDITNNPNVEIIFPGINEEFSIIDFQERQKIIDLYKFSGKKIILSVGRIVERKNQKLLIESAKILRQKIKDFIFVIIGSGENLENLKNLTNIYNLKDNILFLDNISNRELPYFYSIADVFAMVSSSSNDYKDVEGFGIVYLEAGIFKKVVIGADYGGSVDAIINYQTGFLIENDANKLTDKLLWTFDNKELAEKIGENAYNRIINDFLWTKIAHKLISKL